jgi:hypothetical protein
MCERKGKVLALIPLNLDCFLLQWTLSPARGNLSPQHAGSL